MSYNGVGLQTARGSGTSGYVETNLAAAVNKSQSKPDELVHGHYKKRKLLQQEEERRRKQAVVADNKIQSQAEIVEHMSKRQIDLKCAELRDQLEDDSEDESVIAHKVDALRERLSNHTREELLDADSKTENLSEETHISGENHTADLTTTGEDASKIAPLANKEGKPKYEPRHSSGVNPRVRRQ